MFIVEYIVGRDRIYFIIRDLGLEGKEEWKKYKEVTYIIEDYIL